MKLAKAMLAVSVGVLFMVSAGGVRAEIKPGWFTLSPYIGGYLFDGDQQVSHWPTYGLGLGYNLDEHWGTEAVFNYIDTHSREGAGDVDGFLYRLDGLYHFMPDRRLVPYLATGIGGLTLDPAEIESAEPGEANHRQLYLVVRVGAAEEERSDRPDGP